MSLYYYNKIHPKLEIYRYLILNKLSDKFFTLCKNYNDKIYKSKTDDFITRFIWSNITNYDPLIPYKLDESYDFKQLIIDLNNYNIDSQKLLSDLNIPSFLKKYINIFDSKYNSIDYNKKLNIIITNDYVSYKKYKIPTNKLIIDKLNKFYRQINNSNKNIIIYSLLFRYNFFDSKNQQLAINIDLKSDLKLHFDVNFELFGSAINRFFDNYCSLFYDLEIHFGSKGNFFNYDIKSGYYMCNPPYDESLMLNMAIKLIKTLDYCNDPLCFIITIPIWNYETNKILNKKCNTNYTDMGSYESFNTLKSSQYFYKHYIFCKNDFPYYLITKNININASNTYVIILKNKKASFDLSVFEKLLLKYNLNFQ